MRDRSLITVGLLSFIGIVTLPVWYNIAAGTDPSAPALMRPTRADASRAGFGESVAGELNCVAPREQMRASHMQLLGAWRDDVVRRADRQFVAYDGRHYEKNLTGTCLACHGDKAKFCDRCHDYAGVSPGCTDCHVAPLQPR